LWKHNGAFLLAGGGLKDPFFTPWGTTGKCAFKKNTPLWVVGLHVQKAYLHSLKPTGMRALQLNFLLGVFFFALAATTSFAQQKVETQRGFFVGRRRAQRSFFHPLGHNREMRF